MFYRSFAVGAAVLTASGALYGATATAAPAPVYLTTVGANATQEVMGAVTKTFNASTTAKKENAKATNIFALPPDPGTVAKSDAHCNGGVSIRYVQEATTKKNQRTAPNGAGAGREALATSVTNGDSCTSVARSSSPGSATDPAGTEAYAFAVDSVTWATGKNSAAPTNLSITKLEGVFDCKYTNWDQLGGKRGPILRYFPVTGSGIATFFSGVLGFDPRVLGGVNTCTTVPTLIEQNEATAIRASKRHDAITIFSGGAWITQANKIDPDLRAGFVLRSINGKANPVTKLKSGKFAPGSIVKEANVEPSTYQPTNNRAVQGINNVFNFINTNSVDYKAAASFVGAKSALCTNKDATTISKYGLHPLAKCIEQS
jgi:ABC-type phosphate transport system substrate-binding protein